MNSPAGLADEFRSCLTELLGSRVPDVPHDFEDPVRFYGQWLSERNLGLVPIADAPSFAWAGQWIAIIDAEDGPHAVVMFGSPSGIWLDPAEAYENRTQIEAGWMLTPLDLHLPTHTPYGDTVGVGTVAAMFIAPAAESPLRRVDAAVALPGRGLDGDRYANGAGTFSAPGRGYELTLIEAEVLDEIELPWEQSRRNLVTRGISLNGLVGRRFHIGPVECVGRRLAEPCAHLEKLARPGLLRPLVHRGGLRADIISGGMISTDDRISQPSLHNRRSQRD